MSDIFGDWSPEDFDLGELEKIEEQEMILENGKHYLFIDAETKDEIAFIFQIPNGAGMFNQKALGASQYPPSALSIPPPPRPQRKQKTISIERNGKHYGEVEILQDEIIISYNKNLVIKEKTEQNSEEIDTTVYDTRDPALAILPSNPYENLTDDTSHDEFTDVNPPRDDATFIDPHQDEGEPTDATFVDRFLEESELPTNSELTNPGHNNKTPVTIEVVPGRELPELQGLYQTPKENSLSLARYWHDIDFKHPQEEAIRITSNSVYSLDKATTIGFIIPIHNGFIFKTYDIKVFIPKNKNFEYIFGRHVIPHSTVSRQQFSIKVQNGRLSIRDGGPERPSTSGTSIQKIHYDLSGNESELLSDGELKKVHFKQGEVGDCTVLGAITGIIKHPYAREILLPLIQKGQNGDWHLEFQGFKGTTITVNESEVDDTPTPIPQKKGLLSFFKKSPTPTPKKVTKRAKSDSLLIRLLEKGYAKLIQKFPEKFNKKLQDLNIPQGEVTQYLEHGVGMEAKARHHLLNIVGPENIDGFPFKIQYRPGDPEYKIRRITKALAEYILHPESYIMTTAQPAINPIPDPKGRFIPQHCYTIGWVSKTHIEIINPWDTKEKRHIITMHEFFKYFGQVRGIKLKDSAIENLQNARIRTIKNSFEEISTKQALPIEEDYDEPTMSVANGEINP